MDEDPKGKAPECLSPQSEDGDVVIAPEEIYYREYQEWESITATLEESRIEYRNVSMQNEPSEGEFSMSFTAFLQIHEGYYDRVYDEYYFHRWMAWHQEMSRRRRRALDRQRFASLAYDRSRSVRYTRPKMRKRPRSEVGEGSVSGVEARIGEIEEECRLARSASAFF
ncbi:uncharacterized protein EI90DRAFT_3039827 [Cantharellus anzutake]|uniref:uncharacterized protein n=1 Tax=Cantharellus anzutake TaxID=1750568 RepID=UPI001905902B|nr:uncharacterized protein EI90DRAFT_3039827 [Cantharellus anzutake]KAF8338957.1 hypothetical protein EI90DRAFT_3039827 [Cantharellus anzutake]